MWEPLEKDKWNIWDDTVGKVANMYALAEDEITPDNPVIPFEIGGGLGVYMEFDLRQPKLGIHRVREERSPWTLWLRNRKVMGATVVRYSDIKSEDYV